MGIMNIHSQYTIFGIITLMLISSISTVNAELSFEDKLEFASEKEQIIGHIISALNSIQDEDYDVAKMHLMHPLAINFPNIQSIVLKNDLQLDGLELTLKSLTFVNPKSDFKLIQYKLIPIFKMLGETEKRIIGEQLKKDSKFQLKLIVFLLEKSIEHHKEYLELDDEISKKTKKQDSLSLAIKSHMLLNQITNVKFDKSIKTDFRDLFLSYEYDIDKVPLLEYQIINKIEGIILENILDVDYLIAYQKDLQEMQNIEEVLGHLRMAEEHAQNNNSQLAIAHISHAINELQNKQHASNIPQDYMDQLLLLLHITNSFNNYPIEDFDKNIHIVRAAINEIKIINIGEKMMNDQRFQVQTAKYLLELSKTEYVIGLRAGGIFETNIEIQDAYAFTKQAQNILKNSMDDNLDYRLEEQIKMIQNLKPIDDFEGYVDSTIEGLQRLQLEIDSKD